jgi:raffinose/stachyose/melibiose transport system substrate-binding protein
MEGRSMRVGSRPKLFLVAIAVTALAGCTGVKATLAPTAAPPAGSGGTAASATAATSEAPPTGQIRYLVEAPENAEDLNPLKQHLKDFEKAYPGVTVKLEAIPLESLRTSLQTQLRGPNSPDVFAWGSGPAYAGALAKAGLLYDLTSAYAKYKWPIYEGAKKQVTFDGKIVGVPGEMETVGIYYNKKIFSDLGISEPKNLADVEAAAQKIKAAGKIPFAVADKEGWEGSHWLSMALSSRVGGQGILDLLEGRTSWNSPDVIAALSIWQKWNKAGFFPPTPTGVTYDNGNALFYSGKAAMVPTGSWLVNDLEAAPEVKFDVGYIPFPSESGGGIWSVGLGSGPYISANTKNPTAALAFVNWLVSPEHGRWVVENLKTIPPYPVDTSGLKVSPLFGQVLKNIADVSGGSSDLGANIDVQSTDVFNNAMFNGVQALLTGKKTPEQVAADLDAAYKKGKS